MSTIPARSYSRYSLEQKIVAAVWYHESPYTGLSRDAIRKNFEIRFQMNPPKYETISSWEQRLFKRGGTGLSKSYERTVTSLGRLVHVPYVIESLKRNPNLSIRERARILGLSFTTLAKIIKNDLTEYEKEKSELKVLEKGNGSSNMARKKESGQNK